jgi:signal transduction histidine kinase
MTLATTSAEQPQVTTALTRDLLVMMSKIACIVFLLEALIMIVLSGFDLNEKVIYEGLLDSSSLTLLSSPLIYLWVARPFVDATRVARLELTEQLTQSRRLLEQNEILRRSLQRASATTADVHERIIQRIGADLHDGPAQLLTFALLKLDRLNNAMQSGNETKSKTDVDKMRAVITQTLREIREISSGLSLPELDSLDVAQAIALAVRRHQEATNTKVELSITGLSGDVSISHKTCIYRLVQEALSNAFRHSRASTYKVSADGHQQLVVCVTDDGCGFDVSALPERSLGLSGMRARANALGGRLEINSTPGMGTTLKASFELADTRRGERS